MAISAKMQQELNGQLNYELGSSYLYLSMAAHLTATNMPGGAWWLRTQAHEELLHAMKIHDFILERGGRVVLAAVDAPRAEWDSPAAAFAEALTHEQSVTARVNALYDAATGERDHATANMVRWLIDEQVEEEATLEDILHKFKLVEGNGSGLYMLDQELSRRPPPVAIPGTGQA